MADKQQILAAAVPDLVEGLVNPKCVDAENALDRTKWEKAKSPTDMCPAGKKRDFNPILDVHIGIITSSLGGHGASGVCDDVTDAQRGRPFPHNDDKAHLVARAIAGSDRR